MLILVLATPMACPIHVGLQGGRAQEGRRGLRRPGRALGAVDCRAAGELRDRGLARQHQRPDIRNVAR